jgi:hypothetical protein
MNRRTFLCGLTLTVAAPLPAWGQQSTKVPTIGFLGASTPSAMRDWVAAFLGRLRELARRLAVAIYGGALQPLEPGALENGS